ncbi:MAG: type II toxin-antitoxin system PemK/MazF family toxin [Beijerinckiaceae bacterium]
MDRGDIYWVDIPDRTPEGREITKSRPCIVISVPALNKARSTVVMLPLTSNAKAAPPIALFTPSAGKDSVAVCDQLLAVDKRRIRNKAGQLSQKDREAVDDSLRMLLGL